ncbi:MAG: NUDIX hydrolase [Saprospiraceae bacterium]|nr:NUDIX hydrolase [Saprospiraceae bacterium]
MESLDNFPKPSVTVDNVIFGYHDNKISLLLLNRKEEPFANTWTLPGGFLHIHESFEQAAKRILTTKTGVNDVFLEQLYTFDTPERDPRGRVLSVAYYALVNPHKYEIMAGSAANDVQWFDWKALPKLGFDHDFIVQTAVNRLKTKVLWQPIGFELLDERFTMPELHALYETILEREFERRNFYKRIMELEILKKVDIRRDGSRKRPADLFEFDSKKYNELINKGLSFKI